MNSEKMDMATGHLPESLLNEYSDGRLDPETQAAVEQHLADCAGCQAQVNEMAALFQTLNALPEVALPRDLSAQILADLPPAGLVRWPSWVRLVLAGQVALVLVLLFWLWPQLSPGWTALADTGRVLSESLATLLPEPFILPPLSDLLPGAGITLFPAGFGMEAVLPVAQLALLAGLALVAWVVGNALLLRRGRSLLET